MEFSSVAREMFRLYREGRFQDGVSLVVRARESLPEQDGRLTFWEACLRAMAGESDRAVEVLSDGTKRGLWWPEGMLADTDLDSARGQQGWRDLVAACREQEIARLAERPAVQVRGGSVREPCSHSTAPTLTRSTLPASGRPRFLRLGL